MAKKKSFPPPNASAPEDLRVPLFAAGSIAVVWTGFLLWNHLSQFPPRWDEGLSIAANVAGSFLTSLTPALAKQDFLVLAGGTFVAAASVGLGLAVLRLLRITGEDRLERWTLSFALGAGLQAHLLLGLAAVKLLFPGAVWALAILSLGAGFLWGRAPAAAPAPAGPGFRRGFLRLPLLDKAMVFVLASQLLHALFLSLTPVIFYDSLVYHLGVLRLYQLHHGLTALPFNLYAHLPSAVPFYYLFGILIGGDGTVKPLCFLLGAASTASAFLAGRRMGGIRTGLWAAAIFSTVFQVTDAFRSAGTDLGIALFSSLAIYCFSVWAAQAETVSASPAPPSGRWLIAAGLFSGLALSAKYTAVFVPAGIVASLLVFGRRRGLGWRALFRAVLTVGLLSAAVLSPWLIKNAVYKGNPVFPFMARAFPGPGDAPHAKTAALFTEASQYDVHSPVGWALLPWDISMGNKTGSELFSPLFLAFLPLLFFSRRAARVLFWPAAAAGFFFLGWGSSTTLVRYLIPALPILAALAAWAAVEFPPSSVLRAAALFMLVTNFFQGVLLVASTGEARPAVGLETRDRYLSSNHQTYPCPAYPVVKYANENLPASAKILFVGEARGFQCLRDHITSSVFDPNPLAFWADRSADGEDLARTLRREGVTHVLVNLAEVKRTYSYGYLAMSPAGWAALEQFWARRAVEVAHDDEMVEGRAVNHVALYEILGDEDAARPHPAPEDPFAAIRRGL